MCHKEPLTHFGEQLPAKSIEEEVSALVYGEGRAARKIAVLPDIYGLTPFYQGFSSFLARHGAEVHLVNPWQPFGELPESTREAAYERRHMLRDTAYCNQLALYIDRIGFDAVIGFCIGGNFLLELVRGGYRGISSAVYPLPWGMSNVDALDPAFDYMGHLPHPVTILMGEEDSLAGADNIRRLQDVCGSNPALTLHLYPKSNHGFLTDIDSGDELLRANAYHALEVIVQTVFPAGLGITQSKEF